MEQNLIINEGKQEIVEIDGVRYSRRAIKTHTITKDDHLSDIIRQYVTPLVDSPDLIVVMSQGRIIEQGTHEQLLALGGMYAKLIHMQSFEN